MSEGRSSGCGIIGFLLIVVLLVGAMFAGGWLMMVQTPTQTQIILDKEKVKSDTNMAVEKGRELVDQATQSLENGTEDATDEPSDDEPEAEEADSSNVETSDTHNE